MKKTIILALLVVTNFAFAKKEHRHHEAHVHGSAQLHIAFDNLVGKLEFKAASEGVVGFEHKAKSDKDKKALEESITKFENSISKMVAFDPKAECVFMKEKIEMVTGSGNHSDFVANYQVTCKQNLFGSILAIDFTKFKKIKDLDVVIMVNDLQKSVEVKRKPVTIELK